MVPLRLGFADPTEEVDVCSLSSVSPSEIIIATIISPSGRELDSNRVQHASLFVLKFPQHEPMGILERVLHGNITVNRGILELLKLVSVFPNFFKRTPTILVELNCHSAGII